jgi:hypothetical protein
MIYINDEKIENYPEQYKFMEEKTSEIKKRLHIPRGQKTYNFVDPSPIRITDEGRQERKANILIPNEAILDGMRWNLCKNSTVDKSGVRKYEPHASMINSHVYLNPDKQEELEKIFFYMYITPIAQKVLVLENKEEKARIQNESEKDSLEVRYLVLSENSPISTEVTGTEEALRYIAYAWGVKDSSEVSIEMLKRDLIQKVETSQVGYQETKRGYKEFIKEAYNIHLLKTRIDIQFAADNQILEYDNFRWKYKATNTLICVLPTHQHSNPIKGLENHFNKDFKSKDEFDQVIEKYREENFLLNYGVNKASLLDDDIPEEWSGITLEELNKITFPEKKKIAKGLGLRVAPTVNSDELTKLLIAKLRL